MIKKTLLAVGIVFLLVAVSLPVTALTASPENVKAQEMAAIEQFMDEVERAVANSHSFNEFLDKLKNITLNNDNNKYPVIRDFLHKIISYLIKHQALYIGGINVFNLLEKFSPKAHSDYFVLSYGVYHRLNPRKENSIDRFKAGLSMWRYSDVSKIIKGRTLVLELKPFGVHQRMVGPQLGLMKGFKGIYVDVESKLTGKAYVFFMGRADRIRAFDLTPRSK